jgi:ATP-binding cassette subfamily F protein uup
LILRDIDLSFGGGEPLLEGAELSLTMGETVCLVGRNGSGKSTLLKIAAGLIEADGGERFIQPGATVRYLQQEPDLSGFETTLAFVEAGLAPGDDPYRAVFFLNELGLSGDEDPATLSGGEARRCALAQVMAPNPDILMLDEPTNHLDLPAIEWLEGELKSMRAALVLISHDRRFLSTLSTATVWLDRGRARRLDQGFSAFEAWRDEALEQEQVERHKLDRQIVREEHWITYGVTARRKRNQGRLRALQALRTDRREQRKVTGAVKLAVTEGEVSGKLVSEAKHIGKSYNGVAVVDDVSMRIRRGDRLGIVGPNGAGKTTLLNMLTGVLEPDEGVVRLGAALQTVTLDQRRESLDPNWRLADALTGGQGDQVEVQGKFKHVIGYMKDFLFAPEQARTVISALSGGERGRLMLARALARPSNLLVLDEPTNDLDLETLDLLQEMLADYPGTVILVSHDRDFLDRVATSIIASHGAGRWIEYAGGYSDMMIQRNANSANSANSVNSVEPTAKPLKSNGAKKQSNAAPAQKMTFRDKHALQTLPGEIDALQAVIAASQAKLADPNFFAKNPSAFQAAADALKAAEADLAKTEERWLELELQREEIEAG